MGTVTFDKIQIKEVTSHFRNGWVFIVIFPKVPTVENNNYLMCGPNSVSYTDIRPLIIEKTVVKA